uniref:26S proteasome non-ATPase regulatory subunit 6 n=1 Tax=Cajanus cajan TaxID=3821 RepID=A0A151RVN2_CAJCA|nr:26S proteasome non-ATPase regulatory subunit 6 [Cajanus cajan]
MEAEEEEDEEEHQQEEHLVVATNLFLLTLPPVSDIDKVRLKRHDMLPFYETLIAGSVFDPDRALLDSLRNEKITDAEESLGESEVREAHLAKSLFFYLDWYELFPYDTFIFYTVLISIISLDRVSKQKFVHVTVIDKIPYLSDFLNSLYDCQYQSFFKIMLDRYLHPHFRYYMREVRTVVYSQFLESRFIASGGLHCKIDKVARSLPIEPYPEIITRD